MRATLLALLLLAPLAAAGTERAPEIDDGPDPVDPAHDLHAAWFETTREGVRFTLRVGAAAQPQRDAFYYVAFTHGGARHMAGLGYDADGVLRTYLGPPGQGVGGQDLAAWANGRLADARHAPGAPSDFEALIPRDALDGLQAGAALEDLSAGVDRLDPGRAWRNVDARHTSRAYVVEEAGLRALADTAPWGTLGGLVLVGAIAAGGVAWRRTRKRGDANPPPEPDEPPEAPPEPPPRLRLDPREKP